MLYLSRTQRILRRVTEIAGRTKGSAPKTTTAPANPQTQPSEETDSATPTVPMEPPLQAEAGETTQGGES